MDADQVDRIVKGRQISQLFNIFENFLSDDDRVVESIASVHHTMSDGSYFIWRADDTRSFCHERFTHCGKSLTVTALGQLSNYFAFGGTVDMACSLLTDFLNNSTRICSLIGRVKEIILERGGTAVHNEKLHRLVTSQLEAVGIVTSSESGSG